MPDMHVDLYPLVITHVPLDKMATILADNSFQCIFVNENDRIFIQISLRFDPGKESIWL